MAKLTERNDTTFELCFKYPLETGYTFKELSQSDLKKFQAFLDKVAKMTVSQVDYSFARKPDKDDKYCGLQVLHYEVGEKFRIHVVLEEGTYKVIRLDPNHKVHDK